MTSILSFSKALFLDRDGTIIKEVPPDNPEDQSSFGYVTRLSQIEIIDGTDKAISLARKMGFKVIVISNQSAIARGWLTEEKLEEINKRICLDILKRDPLAIIDDFFYSPYHVDGTVPKYKIQSEMRKPGIGMILEAKKKHNIKLEDSFLIGDSYSDMKCAENAGLRKILVLTGYGKQAYRKCLDEGLKINFIANNIYDAVKYIGHRIDSGLKDKYEL